MKESYARGAFVAYPPESTSEASRGPGRQARLIIPFRFNPEGLSRSFQIEQGKSGSGSEVAPGAAGAGQRDQSADASSGMLKQTFTVQVRFDLEDRPTGENRLDFALGVSPELAALERLMHPMPSASDEASDGSEASRQRMARPTVLFVWGRHRVLPVKILGMNVNETMHNAELHPVRAEVDVNLEVLSEVDGLADSTVRAALVFTAARRDELANKFFDATASQGSNILPL
jgi:hypothetical protein